jgi:RNA polymerase sigma-70 factor (ECF subfamily)
LTEKELIQSCIRGKEKAQKILYEQYGPFLMGMCMRYTNNREDAEEVFHDAMLKVFRYLPEYKFNSALKTWMVRIGINASIDFLRKKRNALMVEYVAEYHEEKAEIEFHEELPLKAELAMELLNQLPVNQKLIINMYLIDGYSHKEIANELNISEDSSRTQYFRARKKLAELVKKNLHRHEKQR